MDGVTLSWIKLSRMNHHAILDSLLQREDLSYETMTQLMESIMKGEVSEVRLAALLAALRSKGEAVSELSAAVQVMRRLCTRVEVSIDERLIDTCGTGGDGKQTFNVSTAAAFVAAVGGARVAKHGNRSVSSRCGSADLLMAAGAELNLTSENIAIAINELGFGFIFAPMHHQAMKYVVPVRKELGVRTMFNLLGPLTNPAGCQAQLLGLYSRDWLLPLGKTLQGLGSKRVLLVHSEDGMDEISASAPTYIVELRHDEIKEYELQPREFGIASIKLEQVQVANIEESLERVRQTLRGQDVPGGALVALNAGAALYVASVCDSLVAGVKRAQEILASGAALRRLEDYVAFTCTAAANV